MPDEQGEATNSRMELSSAETPAASTDQGSAGIGQSASSENPAVEGSGASNTPVQSPAVTRRGLGLPRLVFGRWSVPSLLQTMLGLLVLSATAWFVWPWRDGQALPAYFVPTVTATITRVRLQRTPTSTPFVPTATPEPVIHVVKPKDVLGIIAKEYGVTEKSIMEANGLKSDLIIDGQKLLIPSPQRTPIVTRMITPSATSTPTPSYRCPAPALLWPPDGAEFQGRDARIVLQWTSVAMLQSGEWYEVKLWSAGESEDGAERYYTRTSTLIVPPDAFPSGPDRGMRWTVVLIYRARRSTVLSLVSVARGFVWK